MASAHGEELVNWVESMLAVSLWGSSEELDVVQNMVVVGKVIGWDNVDASVLLDLPVLRAKTLRLCLQLVARELAAPVGFVGLFEVTKNTLAGKTENGGLDHSGGLYRSCESWFAKPSEEVCCERDFEGRKGIDG